jgi:hypothetical protein
MSAIEHLEEASATLGDLLRIASDPNLKAKIARAYADVSIALVKIVGDQGRLCRVQTMGRDDEASASSR